MSNHTNDPWETEMSRTFDQRVRDLNEAPLNLDQVKGKAVRIRRNRRIAVAGGVLAAAAVIVPVAVIAGNGLNDNDSGPGFAEPDPNPTAKDPEGLDFGYLEGKTLHLADGSTMELAARYTWATRRRVRLRGAQRRRDRLLTLDVTRRERDPDESLRRRVRPGRERRPHDAGLPPAGRGPGHARRGPRTTLPRDRSARHCLPHRVTGGPMLPSRTSTVELAPTAGLRPARGLTAGRSRARSG